MCDLPKHKPCFLCVRLPKGLGATITCDKDTGTIGVTKKNHRITLTIGSTTVWYIRNSSAAPKVIKGVTYVTAQIFARGLGARLEYCSSSNSLKISI